jgi:hypothetical protein
VGKPFQDILKLKDWGNILLVALEGPRVGGTIGTGQGVGWQGGVGKFTTELKDGGELLLGGV